MKRESVKNFLKRLSPRGYESLRYFRDVLESMQGHLRRKRAEHLHRNDKKTVIVFIIHAAESWNSLRSVYEAFKKRQDIESYIVVKELPNKEKDYKESLEYVKTFEPGVIMSDATHGHFNVKTLSPKYVFVQTPYPTIFDINQYSKYAKICYVPYGFQSSKKHLLIENGHTFLAQVSMIFASNASAESFYVNEIKRIWPRRDIQVYNIGFPRFDLQSKNPPRKSEKQMVVGWTPRWSLDANNNDASNFLQYKDCLMKFFARHPEYELIIRPHPLMFQNFIDTGAMTQAEVDTFKRTVENAHNVSLDSQKDYLVLFEKSDVMIMDFTSLLVEFYLTGKPIIYCGDTAELVDELKELLQYSYCAKKWDALQHCLEMIAEKSDPMCEKRKTAIQNFYSKSEKSIGEKIVDICMEN